MMRRRMSAVWRVSHTAGGSTTRESKDSVGESATIAMIVAIVMVRLVATEVAVVVTTPRMPAMSLVRRDCTSPPRLRVKN